MRNYQKRIIGFIILAMFLVGCTNSNNQINSETPGTEDDNMSSHNSSKTTINVEEIFNNEIVFYELSRDGFEQFLNNQQYDFLKTNSLNILSYKRQDISENKIYAKSSLYPYDINNSLWGFVGNTAKIKTYLAQNNITSDIISMAIIDAPNVPLVLWINTDNETCYITITPQDDFETYVYEYFSHNNFKNMHIGKPGVLIINGQTISTNVSPQIYHTTADIPLLPVLRNLGATISTNIDGKKTIVLNDKKFILDIENKKLFSEKNDNENILYEIAGGCTFVYKENEELLVDNSTLLHVLITMGKKTTISVNYSKKTVNISCTN